VPDSLEFRTTAVDSAVESTKGWVWGAAGYGPGQTPASVTAPYEKNDCDRTRKPGPRFSPPLLAEQTHSTNEPHTVPTHTGGGGRGLCPPDPPRFIARVPISERNNRNGTPLGVPSPILAPESALGSRLRVALSSAQVTDHLICAPTAEPLAVRAPPAKRRPICNTVLQTMP
jgi:hypothetical protein